MAASTVSNPPSASPLQRVSHAQTGQDILCDYFFGRYKLYPEGEPGFFVDVGCAWPIQASNTYYFYERGWRGVCIDANSAMEKGFKAARPEDTFVNCGIGETEAEATLYMFKDPKHNTFNPKRRETWATQPARAHLFRGERTVPIRRLSNVLDEAAPGRSRIDLLSIDVESMELEVLKSMDFGRHQPSMVILEMLMPVSRVIEDPVTQYLLARGYELISHTSHDTIFIKRPAKA